jgi:hypothetical protein
MRMSVWVLGAGFGVTIMAAMAGTSTPAAAQQNRFCAQYDDGREECAYPSYQRCIETLRGVYQGRCFENSKVTGDADAYAPRRVRPAHAPVNCTRYLGHGKWTDCR